MTEGYAHVELEEVVSETLFGFVVRFADGQLGYLEKDEIAGKLEVGDRNKTVRLREEQP